MLENYHLAAIEKQGQSFRLMHIPLHQNLQVTLATSWQQQYHDFLDQIDEIPFDAGYTPERHERFSLEDYHPPPWLAEENSLTVQNLDPIGNDNELLTKIAGIAAFARNSEGREVILFQNFSRSRVINPGSFLFLETNTYTTPPNPGITLEERLVAILFPNENKLLFRNFRITNTFLPLSGVYREASEQDIREVLDHPLLFAEDPDALATDANQWFRKRFAMLRESEVLDRYSAQQIEALSHGYEVDIQVADNQLVFPAERTAAKRLLQFLNEERFRGAITDTLYETNSKRAAT